MWHHPASLKATICGLILIVLCFIFLNSLHFLQPSPNTPTLKTILHIPNHPLNLDLDFSHRPVSCLLNGRHPKMVLFISSRPSDFNRRISIRGTWGRIAGSCSVKVIFGFGKTGEKSGLLERKIAKESRQFGDILQSAAVRDGYRNQTRLVMAFFRYAARECEGTRLVGKADDDIWINFPAILPVLESITSAAYIAGYFFPNGTAVLRDPVHPQSLSRADRETNHYPAYASGAFYALPLRLLGRILSAAENLKVHWIDDAFLTGDVVEAINGNASLWSLPDDRSLIRRIGLNGYTALPDFQTSDGCRLLGSTLIHKVSPEMQRWLHEVPCLSKLHRCRLDGGASSIRTTPTS